MPATGPSRTPLPTEIAPPLVWREFRFDDLKPEREQIHRLVGLKPGRENHKRWFELVDEMLGELPRITRARGLFRIDDIEALESRRIVLASGVTYCGAVGAFLRHATRMATFVVTIGSALERLSRRWLRAGKIMQGTIVDAIASEMAEAAAARIQDEVRAWAVAEGMEITPRFSPGYCGLHVREQTTLFATMPTERINVRLTPSCLMLPMKSVSGLIGIGPVEQVSPGAYPCALCSHEDCTQRRAPFDENRGRCWDLGAERAGPEQP